MEWKCKNDTLNIQELMRFMKYDVIVDRVCSETKISKEELEKIISEEDVKMLLGILLSKRGYANAEAVERLVNNPACCINSPYILTNAEKAALEIAEHIKDKDNIIRIYSDYDVDGITAGKTMSGMLKDACECDIQTYYPSRADGYGLSMKWCKELVNTVDTSKTMVITVDNGITKVEEVKFLVEHGVKVVVTDHHVSQEEVPNCTIVNPHNAHEEQDENTKHLCGCAVAFKVAQIVQYETMDNETALDYIPFVALSTIADVMPFTYENIALIQFGINMLNDMETESLLKPIIKAGEIDILTVKDVQWSIAPMVNAIGRMDRMELVDEVFDTEHSYFVRLGAAKKIVKLNDDRKKMTKKAIEEIEKEDFTNRNACIGIIGPEFNHGIAGNIAGKLAEKHQKISIIVHNTDGKCSGSARSFGGINLLEIFATLKKQGLVTDFGGHAPACGVSFNFENIEKIYNILNDIIVYEYKDIKEIEEVQYEVVLPFKFINKQIYMLSNMIPFDGKDKPMPVYRFVDMKIKTIKSVASNPDRGWVTFESDGISKKIFMLEGYENLLKMINEDRNAKYEAIGSLCNAFWDKNLYTFNLIDLKQKK